MLKFKVINTSSKNHTTVGDVFRMEDKIYRVTKITRNSVYFGSVVKFPKFLIDKWMRIDLEMEKAREQQIKDNQRKIKLYDQPLNALRYVILYDFVGKKYAWQFANQHTTHAILAEKFISLYGPNWSACGGGFYGYRTANTVKSGDQDIFELFGVSDSYGLNEADYTQALQYLRIWKGTILNDEWVRNYFISKRN